MIISFKQFINESFKLPHRTDYRQKATLPRDTQGTLYDGSHETIPEGTEISIDDINTWRDGSVDITAHYQDVNVKLQYDSKSEAEKDLGITI